MTTLTQHALGPDKKAAEMSDSDVTRAEAMSLIYGRH